MKASSQRHVTCLVTNDACIVLLLLLSLPPSLVYVGILSFILLSFAMFVRIFCRRTDDVVVRRNVFLSQEKTSP